LNIEHCSFLSWFSDNRESHEQDGEKLPRAGDPRLAPASGDPAMAFEPFVDSRATFCSSPDYVSAVSAAALQRG
jgi:hypothetical protein